MPLKSYVIWSKITNKADFSELVVGLATCPCCQQGALKLINDNGPDGNEEAFYIENHHPIGNLGGELCPGSEQPLKELNAWLRGDPSNMDYVAGMYADFRKKTSAASNMQPA